MKLIAYLILIGLYKAQFSVNLKYQFAKFEKLFLYSQTHPLFKPDSKSTYAVCNYLFMVE